MGHVAEVSVVHNFVFPEHCNALEITKNRESVIGIGAYKPCMAVFDLADQSQKLERNTEEESICMAIVGEDWKKIAMLHKNGKIEFHSQYGKHAIVELPRDCRDMKADTVRGEVVAVGQASYIYRFSTEEGKYKAPVSLQHTNNSSIALNTVHSVYNVCTYTGSSTLKDARAQAHIKTLTLSTGATSTAFSDDGIFCSIGTETGQIVLYDMRSTTPLMTKDHKRCKSMEQRHRQDAVCYIT